MSTGTLVEREESQEAGARRVCAGVAEICGQLNAGHGRLVDLVAEALAGGLWEGWRSPHQWLCRSTGISPGRARQVLRVAEACATHPAIVGRLRTGELSLDQAAVAVGVPAHCDADTAQLATLCTVQQLQTVVRAARTSTHAADADVPGALREEMSSWFDDDGRLILRAVLDPDHGRAVADALQEARDSLFRAGHTAVTWAEALVEMAERSMDAAPKDRRKRFASYVFIDPSRAVPARFADGTPLPTWLHEQLQCDGTVTPVFVEGGLPVSVGRSQEVVPERTRRLVLARDHACRVPWCGMTRWLDVHHIQHREHGGGHDLDNLVALCRFHHRQHHLGDVRISGNPNQLFGLRFTNRHGIEIKPVVRTSLPTMPLPPPAAEIKLPTGDRLCRDALWFPPPPK